MTLVDANQNPISSAGETRDVTIGSVTLPNLPTDLHRLKQEVLAAVVRSGGKVPTSFILSWVATAQALEDQATAVEALTEYVGKLEERLAELEKLKTAAEEMGLL